MTVLAEINRTESAKNYFILQSGKKMICFKKRFFSQRLSSLLFQRYHFWLFYLSSQRSRQTSWSLLWWGDENKKEQKPKLRLKIFWQAGSSFSHLLPNSRVRIQLNICTACKSKFTSLFTLRWDLPRKRVVKYQCVNSRVSDFHLPSDGFLMRIAAGHRNENLEFSTNHQYP